jgi:hypothetical protein
VDLFTRLVAIEDERHTGNDQILMNIFLEEHPDAAHIDRCCTIFQSLWRTRGHLPTNGVFDPSDPGAEVRVLPSARLENRFTGTHPQVIHGFMALNMDPLLESLGFDTAGVHPVSGTEYFKYSINTYLKLFIHRQLEACKRLLGR